MISLSRFFLFAVVGTLIFVACNKKHQQPQTQQQMNPTASAPTPSSAGSGGDDSPAEVSIAPLPKPAACVSTGCPEASSVTCGSDVVDNCGNRCGTGNFCGYGYKCVGGTCDCAPVGACGSNCRDNCGNSCAGGACQPASGTPRCLNANERCGGAYSCCAGLSCTVVGGDVNLVCMPSIVPAPAPTIDPNPTACRTAGQLCGGGFAVCCPGLKCTGGSGTPSYAVCQ